jgi:hypothetical protein
MSNQRITVLASVTILFITAFSNQPLPINDRSEHSVSARPLGNGERDGASVAADDDSDSSDVFQLLNCSIDCVAVLLNSLAHAAIVSLATRSAEPTLESQHILLKL